MTMWKMTLYYRAQSAPLGRDRCEMNERQAYLHFGTDEDLGFGRKFDLGFAFAAGDAGAGFSR